MVQVEKIMKFGLHKGPSGVGRPVVGGVEVLCMLTVQVGDSPETHASMHFTTVPDPHLSGLVVAAGVGKKEYNGG